MRATPAATYVEPVGPPAAAVRPRLPAVGLRAVPAWLPGLGLLLLLTVPAWAPLLHPEFSLWQVFDGSIHLRRHALPLGGDRRRRLVPALVP